MKKYLLPLLALILLTRCAQQVAPTGGKKDTTPPNLIGALPENKTLNFKEKEIELFFDEYVIVDNIQQKLIITPETENPYTYKQKGTSVLLTFKKNFEDSTTYTFNFGDGIKDFAERNPAQNLKLVFSTGSTIDSARVYGKITDRQTNLPVFDALVGLYKPSDTLNPEKQKPYYFSRTDSSGIFAIENIQVAEYRLIALDDKNRNQLYNTKDERIAFLDSSIRVGADSIAYKLELFLSDVTAPRIQRTIPKVNNYTVVFNKAIEKIHVKFPGKDTLAYFLESATQVKFFNSGNAADTTLSKIVAIDSLGQTFEQEQKITFLQQRGKDRQLDVFTVRTTPERNKPLARNFTYTFFFNKPIITIQPEQIELQNDSLSKKPLSEMTWQWNPYRTELTVEGKSSAKDSIRWIIPKGALISVEGDTLMAGVYKHPVLKEDEYGILRCMVKADSGTHYIVELVSKEFKVVRTTTSSPYSFIQIPPGDYQLRIIIDKNNNGRWDTGIFKEGKQAERIIYYPSLITVKSNFEFDDNNFILPSKTSD
jgi:hypothetical protein